MQHPYGGDGSTEPLARTSPRSACVAFPQVPQADGEVVLEPPFDRWPLLLKAGRQEAANWRLRIAGLPARNWREESRRDLLAAALEATRKMEDRGLPLSDAPSGPVELLVATGHQPELFHPGVWYKNFLIDAVGRSGAVGLNVIVDSDVPDSTHIFVPTRLEGRWHRSAVRVPGLKRGVPWERLPPLRERQWTGFLTEVEQRLGAIDPDSEALRNTRRFREMILESEAVRTAESLAESLARGRRLWEAKGDGPSGASWEAGEGSDSHPLHYLELPVSALCRTRAFCRFAADLLVQPDRIWKSFNKALQGERQKRAIRSDANPVPDLRRRDDLWETAFWCLHPSGERHAFFVNGRPGAWLLQSKDRDFFVLPSDAEELAERLQEVFGGQGGFQIRPRALTLTLFLRMAACDLFVHGLGGAHYECVNDEIIREHWGIQGTEWAVASATLLAPAGPRPEVSEDPLALHQALRVAEWNPQRFIGEADGDRQEALELARRKQACIQRLAATPRGARAPATREIRSINQTLSLRLESLRSQLQQRLDEALARQQEQQAATNRSYPFFLVRPSRLAGLVPHEK